MDFEFSAEQEELRESVRRFLAERAPLDPVVRGLLDDPRGTTDELWKGLVELGLTGILVPETFEGVGLGMVEMGVVLEEMGRALTPGPYLASALGAVALVRDAGGERDRADLLPRLASGATVATLAVHEPERRWDWREPATEARPEGSGFRLTGAKAQVLDGCGADLLLVAARAADGLGVFAVERAAEGVTTTPVETVDGTRKVGEVALAGAPATRVGSGDASEALARAIDLVNVGLVVDAVGAASRALEISVDYAKEREQFGRAIGSFQAVQHLLVEMLQQVELGRAGAYYALWAADAGDAAELHRAAAMAKAFASETFPHVGASAIQVFGGVGFTWEYDVHLYYKRLLSMQHAFGDAGHHLDALARLVLD